MVPGSLIALLPVFEARLKADTTYVTEAVMTWLRLLLVLVATISLAGCEVVGDIFQAGMAVGVIMVVAVIALIGFLIAKIRS